MIDSAARLLLRDPRTARPLRVLITRPDEQAEETAELVRACGGLPLVFPCLRRAPPSDPAAFVAALSHPGGYTAVAITSVNAAQAVGEALAQLSQHSATTLRRALFAAVGPRTAAALAAQGLTAQIVADEERTGEGLASSLIAALRERGLPPGEQRILVPRAAVANPALIAVLQRAEVSVIETVAYEMLPASATTLESLAAQLRSGEVDLLPFGSPRTAAVALSAFAADELPTLLEHVVIGAIGPTTASALREAGVRVDVVSETATFAVLLRNMQAFLTIRREL